MRRSDKEVGNREQIEDVIRRSTVCRLALVDDGRPYLVPLCFGYDGSALYFHSANEGKKLDILGKNRSVCFEFDIDAEPVRAETACGWTMRYRSVVGSGTATLLEDPKEKKAALATIMRQYADGAFELPEETIHGTAVIKVEIQEITGKISGYGIER